MGGKEKIDMHGRVFGTLKVVAEWGSQSGNIAWTYFCQACGHHGHRLGSKLRRDGAKTRCPR